MQQLRAPLTLYAFLFLVFTPAIGVFGGCGAVRVLFLLPTALGFTGDNGSGDDEPTLDTVDSRLDRLVRVRGLALVARLSLSRSCCPCANRRQSVGGVQDLRPLSVTTLDDR